MGTYARTTWGLIVTSVFISALLGCQPACEQAWRYVPDEQQASDWVARRQFVIEVVHDLTEPMPGTTYHGHSRKQMEGLKSSMLCEDMGQSIRKNIRRMGGYAEIAPVHYEFDVTVSEDLMAEGNVDGKLHDYYARRLADAGWHICAGGCSGIPPKRKWYYNVWTDLPGSHDRSNNTLAVRTEHYGPATARRGFFYVRIAVSLDEVSNKAHVAIDYLGGKIGKPASST